GDFCIGAPAAVRAGAWVHPAVPGWAPAAAWVRVGGWRSWVGPLVHAPHYAAAPAVEHVGTGRKAEQKLTDGPVAGKTLPAAAILHGFAAVAQLDRVLGYEPRGRG